MLQLAPLRYVSLVPRPPGDEARAPAGRHERQEHRGDHVRRRCDGLAPQRRPGASHHPITPPNRTASSHPPPYHPITPPNHTAQSHRPITPPYHTTLSHHLITPPYHNILSHHPITPPNYTPLQPIHILLSHLPHLLHLPDRKRATPSLPPLLPAPPVPTPPTAPPGHRAQGRQGRLLEHKVPHHLGRLPLGDQPRLAPGARALELAMLWRSG